MQLHAHQCYHFYNRGINRQQVFFSRENYLYFLRRIRTCLVPHADLLAHCLMPNHFHLLLHMDERIEKRRKVGGIEQNELSVGLRNLLGGYARSVNRQLDRTGSLFTQNTHMKALDGPHYATTCFHYIHQNPLRAGLAVKLEDWEMSSFKDYAGLRAGTLCNRHLAQRVLNVNFSRFYEESYEVIDESQLMAIW